MGARVALRMAVATPHAVSGLILESPSAGFTHPAVRATRRASDEELARLLESDGIAAFVDRWEKLPLFASERAMPPEWRARLHAERMSCRPEGLAASLRGAGQGSMEPLHDRLSTVSVPTLVIAGELDAVGADRAEAVAAAIPGAQMHVIPGMGHAPHREAPRRVLPLFIHATERNQP
jgi:2-succinyl-6-hydroxy-2,4-cyclohexadiene-1-carboxylate synthase